MGLVPLFPCCPNKTTGGTYGCVNFTITLSGDCTGAILQLNFVTPAGVRTTFNIAVPNSSYNAHTFAAYVVNYINDNIAPYTATLVGNQSSSTEVQVCPPNDPAYFGTKLVLNVTQGIVGGNQATTGNEPVPYVSKHTEPWWGTVTYLTVNITVTCGINKWVVPQFDISPASAASEITTIVNTLNSYFTTNSLPFLAVDAGDGTNFYVEGTEYTLQNGCTVSGVFKAYAGGTYVGNSQISFNAIMSGGTESQSGTLGVSGGTPQTLTMGTASTVTYDITGCGDCRQGKYMGDTVPDDIAYVLPAFGSSTDELPEHNDSNSWFLEYPEAYDAIANGDFSLEQKQADGSWLKKATLNDNTYGMAFNNNMGTNKYPFYNGWPFINAIGTCTDYNYQGYLIDWRKVLIAFGEGTYRFSVTGHIYGSTGQGQDYCFKTPSFCLQEWDCYKADGTARFLATYAGGNFGSVTEQGVSWQLCCPGVPGNGSTPPTAAIPIGWQDAVRFPAFFGYQYMDYQVTQVKFQTGQIKKVRDEALKKFTLKTNQLPKWLLDRIAAYALMCDKLFVTDANYNNPDYNIKNLWVVRDSSFKPKWQQESRYAKVLDLAFVEGQQYIYRDRCC